MATNFGTWPLRSMDIRSRHTVYGYIRRCDFEFLQNKNVSIYIPDEIYHIVLIFYYIVQDYFVTYGYNMATDTAFDDQHIDYKPPQYVTSIINLGKTSSTYSTAYGELYINPFENKIHKWSFKIHRSNGDCYIGIDSSHDVYSKVNESFINQPYDIYGRWQNLQQFYAISSMGYKYSHYTMDGKEINDTDSDVIYRSGDKLKMIIDFKGEYGKMSVSVNNDKYVPIFRMIPKSKSNPDYRLAVSLSIGSYIELLSYCYSEGDSCLDLYQDEIDE